ncbi:DUF7344 domain-containing protein [Natrononativus amylolyticus]|uniref:DUF7344 domain-containing protein n=1 Tax=Natrononativus amylolyticus TaxID=2963434 RepID=UPI0020CE5753|nr:hypothetical protein [Natrononativus amylolyticus]
MEQSSNELMAGMSNTAELSTSDQHRLLASERRRLTLDILDGNAAPIELTELATQIVAREDGSVPVTEDAVNRMAVSLHHIHLPLMAEMGVLDYEPHEHLIRYNLETSPHLQ